MCLGIVSLLLLVSNDTLHQNTKLKWAFANHLVHVLEPSTANNYNDYPFLTLLELHHNM